MRESRPIWIAAAFGLGLSGFVTRQVDPLAPVRVTGGYHPADFGPIDLVGVCDANTEGVSCWGPDAKPSESITKRVGDYYAAHPESTLYRKVGSKSRIVILRKPSSGLRTPDGQIIQSAVMPQTSDGEYLQQVGQITGGGQASPQGPGAWVDSIGDVQPEEQWYEVFAKNDVKTCEVSFPLTVLFGEAKLPFRDGATGHLGPMHVRIDSIDRAPDEPLFAKAKGPLHRAWHVEVTITGYQSRRVPDLRGTAFGEQGKTIARATFDGNPVPDNSAVGTTYEGWDPTPVVWGGLSLTSGGGTEHQTLTLAVNPAKVSAISLTTSGIRAVTLTGIPLDPTK